MSEIKEQIPKQERAKQALENPLAIIREITSRSLFEFMKFFWDVVSEDAFIPNWHIEVLCEELEKVARNVGTNKKKLYDLLINVPPGTTKTKTVSVMFPAWCWTKWYWMKFITASYSATLTLEAAEECRDLVRSEKFKALYPEIGIKSDKDTKSNFKVIKRVKTGGRACGAYRELIGGNRFSTSVGGSLTGFHGHILIWDDAINPTQSVSQVQLETANRWLDQTFSTRKTDKAVSTMIGIAQRLHQNDPTGHMLAKKKKNIRHICLPGEIKNYKEQVRPKELIQNYTEDGLLDPSRLDWFALEELEADLGQYGYAGQVGQSPTPPAGGMFKVDNFHITDRVIMTNVTHQVRYWDKAGTTDGGAYTVGVKLYYFAESGKIVVADVKRGQWSSEERERHIRQTAEMDGKQVKQYIEQEPGSGGKESAQATIKNLMGFSCYADRPQGDKVYRADPYSVQVNNGNVYLLRADWNGQFIEEHRFFPYGTYKDQVDGAAGGFSKLTGKKQAKIGA